ncbi:MAG: hypothetical protein ACXW30_00100 [Micavibrio sp.]
MEMTTMLVKSINKALKPFGYKLIGNEYHAAAQADPAFITDEHFVLYSYLKNDGTFDYDRYRKIQEEGNKRKIENVWVLEDNIKFLSEYLENHLDNIHSGLCHGTRRGKEQEWFKKYLGGDVKVIGTEISETATQFPDTIQWDFHEVKPEWVNNIDFIYSNSFDHSYDPEKCLNAWMSCLRKGGVCVLEHTDAHSAKGANELDPFGAHLMQMPYLITKWAKGKYSVREILAAPVKKGIVNYVAFIIIQKH